MEQVSTILKVFFVAITLITVWQFYIASNKSKKFLVIAFVLAVSQLFIGVTNFYENENTIPPRFILLVAPAIVLIVILLSTSKGREFIDHLNLKKLTLLHTIRIPVEIALYFLFTSKAVPQIMTFEGRNFDKNRKYNTISTGILIVCKSVSFSMFRVSINFLPFFVAKSMITKTMAGATSNKNLGGIVFSFS